MGQNTELEARDSHWQGLYRLGGVAALMIAVLLRSEVFSLATAYAGILAGAAGIGAVVLEHVSTVDAVLALAIALYFAAIVFLFIRVVLGGRGLYQLGIMRATAGGLVM